MILRAKTDCLIKTRILTHLQQKNTSINRKEIDAYKTILESKPQRLIFEMTNSCNLSCIMCGRNARHFKLTYFDIKWLNKFNSIAPYVEEVTLMGWGEPTMHPQFIDFLKWANIHGLRKYFCTNGMKLGELLTTIFEQEVDVIAISIDAADNEQNQRIRRGANLNKIIKNLESIVKEKEKDKFRFPYMNFVSTLMKSNLHEFPKIVKLAADIGLDEVKAVFFTVFDKSLIGESLYNSMNEVKEVFDESEEIARKSGINIKLPYLRGQDPAGISPHRACWTTWRDFFLGSDGYVRPCMSTPIKFFHIDDYSNFDEMWNSEVFVNFREAVNKNTAMEQFCNNCYQSSFANWNNKASFYQIGNDFSPDWGK
jgi:MoaA/NifB/PqqE/SkfB family radical SAM enzyme